MIIKIRNIALFLLAWVFLHCLWVVHEGLRVYPGKADIAVVLGNTVFDDGSLSPWLKGRVDQALALYRNGQVKKIFVSGGIGKNGWPEGTSMRNYLIKEGVAPGDVMADDYGDNSYLTAKHFVELNQKENYNSAVVVTSYYHITRTKYIVKKLGFQNVGGDYCRTLFWADWFGISREFAAFYKYLLVY